MAKDLNKVMLTGHLGADPEMRYTPQGSAVTTFRVASGRTWKSSDGTQHDDTEWFRIVAWDKLGEICNQYLTKGTRVYVEGRLQTRKWQDQNGLDRYSTEVVLQNFNSALTMLDGKNSGGSFGADDSGGDFGSSGPSRSAPPRRVAAGGRNDDMNDDIPF